MNIVKKKYYRIVLFNLILMVLTIKVTAISYFQNVKYPFSDILRFKNSIKLFEYLQYNVEYADSVVELILKESDPDHLRLLYSFTLTNKVSGLLKSKILSSLILLGVPIDIIENQNVYKNEKVYAQNNIKLFISQLKDRDQFYRSLNADLINKNQSFQIINDSINSIVFWKFLNKNAKWPSYFYLETIKPNESGLFSMKLNLFVFLIHQIHTDPIIADSVRCFLLKSYEKGELTLGEFLNYEFNYIKYFPSELFGYGRLPSLNVKTSNKVKIAQLYSLSCFLNHTKSSIKIISNSNNSLSCITALKFLTIKSILLFFGVSSDQIKFDIQPIVFADNKVYKIIQLDEVIYKIDKIGAIKITEVIW
ncbi:MAG: hypothetical protein IPF62_01375 [Bacteroidetes bacterium]|nr:hypothetical protein [Bacteroidota bacterium]